MRSRSLWFLLALLALLLIWGYEKVLPDFVERLINRMDDHPEWIIEERAQALHDSIPVADLHADPLLWKRDWLSAEGRGHTDLPRLREGGVALQVLTAVTKSPSGQNYQKNSADTDTLFYLTIAQGWPMETWNSPLARALYQAGKLADWDARAGDSFRVIRNQEELEVLLAGRREGMPWVGGIFGIEGAHALEGNLKNLQTLDELGLRVVGLTHFFDNQLGGSLHGESGEGLTEFGRTVVLEADRRGMTIDVAHASPQMVRDVMDTIESPLILSHGGFQGVCDEGRNLDDALMQELAAHGVLIGVGFWDGAVCDYSPEGVVRSIQYGIDLVGVESIALGSDFDGATQVAFDAGDLAILTQTMIEQGMSEQEIRAVMGENAIGFFQANLPSGR